MSLGFRRERQSECLAVAGLAGSGKEARRAGALPECSRIEGRTRGRRRQRWMCERTRVVVMSRAQANCCCDVVGVLVQEHRGARNGWARVGRIFAAMGASEHRTVARGGRALVFSRASLARRSVFVCPQACSRWPTWHGVRGEAATAPTAVYPGANGGWGAGVTERGGAAAPMSRFSLDHAPAHFGAFSARPRRRWPLGVAAGCGHRARADQGHLGAWVCFVG